MNMLGAPKYTVNNAYERGKGPYLALYSLGGRATGRFGESTSRVRLGVLYMVQDMHSFLSEYSSTIVLVPHAIRCHVTQVE
jgi:hypothetical protein